MNDSITTLVPYSPSTPEAKINIDKFIMISDEKNSTHIWLELICLKNIPLQSVACDIMRHWVKYSVTKSTKVVKDTGIHLCEIVEGKIHSMMDKSLCGQLLFDGWTVKSLS